MAGALQPPTVFPPPSSDDPFVSTPPVRHGAFDPNAFQVGASSKQARLTLEAHLKETDRRIQDASKLGTTLVNQRKELSARLKELSERPDSDEIGPELKRKLADLEKEYTDVGRDTARAVLPRSRLASSDHSDVPQSPAVFSGISGASPSKVAAPSRKQRNAQTNRVHDIEFATEISTSLLAQVRSLQATLAEKDDALKQETSEKSTLQEEYSTLRARLRHLDDNEQKYKDENWNLETQLQDLTASMKVATEREQRAAQSLKATQLESEVLLRELEDLKQVHGRLNEDVAANRRAHEAELHSLRKDLADQDHDRDQLQRQIDELTAQNTELARAISYRMNGGTKDLDGHMDDHDDEPEDRDMLDQSPPQSPTKRAAAGGLESETLKSSLQHAHRMIQTLKNNIQRERTEKLELKRLLQDARDDLESRRGDNRLSALKKRRSELENARSRKVRADQLGSNRVSREEYFNDPDWEDDDGQQVSGRPRRPSMPGTYQLTEESSDAFETANEKETSTETEAFETTHEGLGSEDSGDATETDTPSARAAGDKQRYVSMSTLARKASFRSTASASADEEGDNVSTPVMVQPKYKIKNIRSRNSFRESVAGSNNSPAMSSIFRNSPAFSQASNRSTPLATGQTLGDELDGLSDEDSVMSGTPSRVLNLDPAFSPTGENTSVRDASVLGEQQPVRPEMVDSGMMTEPWEPTAESKESHGLLAAAAGAIGGLVTGGILGREEHAQTTDQPVAAASKETVSTASPETALPEHNFSPVMAQHIQPVEIPQAPTQPPHHSFASILSLYTEPKEQLAPEPVPQPAHSYAGIMTQTTEPKEISVPVPSHGYSSVQSQSIQPVETARAPVTEPVQLSASPIKSQSTVPSIPAWNTAAMQPKTSKYVDAGVAAGAFAGGAVAEKTFDDSATESDQRSGRSRMPFAEISNNAASGNRSGSAASSRLNRAPSVTADEGTQTMVSSHELDAMAKNRNVAVTGAGVEFVVPGSSSRPMANMSSPRLSSEYNNRIEGLGIKRPGGSNSLRSKREGAQPPLPNDHSEKIAQASRVPSGAMGPPLMPASAYRASQRTASVQSRTSTSNTIQKVSSLRRGPANGSVSSQHRGHLSRQSSVSSFASEVDHRLNPAGAFMYPDLPGSTDPRLIAAITQTMIGEYLWKYTRSPLSSTMSSNRHRRFFWVHPYTRTLYWSEGDPSSGGKSNKAKSAAIESIRVTEDSNAYPPGLHQKSIVVTTPSRDIVFTAPTSQRHETWVNALSYLLLRTDPAAAADTTAALATASALSPGELNDEELAEFNPSFGHHRHTAGSQVSVASRATVVTARSYMQDQPTLTPSRRGSRANAYEPPRSPSTTRLTGFFSSRSRTSFSSARSRQGTVGEVMDEEERLRLENVRACCDGKHDVASLSSRGKSARARSVV